MNINDELAICAQRTLAFGLKELTLLSDPVKWWSRRWMDGRMDKCPCGTRYCSYTRPNKTYMFWTSFSVNVLRKPDSGAWLCHGCAVCDALISLILLSTEALSTEGSLLMPVNQSGRAVADAVGGGGVVVWCRQPVHRRAHGLPPHLWCTELASLVCSCSFIC